LQPEGTAHVLAGREVGYSAALRRAGVDCGLDSGRPGLGDAAEVLGTDRRRRENEDDGEGKAASRPRRRGHDRPGSLPGAAREGEAPAGAGKLTSTRLPEYWTVRVVPSGINSTVNVRRAVRFVAPVGGPGSMVRR